MHYDQIRFHDKNIFITSDIDISAYRWVAIGKNWSLSLENANIKGNNHIITGLYCNELEDYQGLFGLIRGVNISNLIIDQCNVYGEKCTGAIAGYTSYSNFVNCAVRGNVYGIENVGGIVGRHEGTGCSIKNTGFVGFVTSRGDITKVNSYNGYVGGICGTSFNDTIINCYVVSEIPDTVAYPGIVTGTGGRPDLVSNCYYKDYETTLPVTSDNCNIANNSSFSGSGISWTLNTPPYVNGEFHSDLVDALNAWVDANNAEGQYRRWTADTAMVNGGFPVFATIPCADINVYDTVVACDSYEWNGQTYTTSGDYTQMFTAANGCDSVVTLHLIVNQKPSVIIDGNPIVCFNGSGVENVVLTAWVDGSVDLDATYAWYESGQYRPNAAGYDNVYRELWGPSNGNPYVFTVVVTDGNGCTAISDSLFVVVNETPEVQVIASETEICVGGTTIINADAVGEGNISYNWSVDYYAGSTNIFAPDQAGTYLFTVTATVIISYCESVGAITINVYDQPEVIITGEGNIIAGQSATLTATGASTYLWSDGSTGAVITVSPAETTTYTVTGTNRYGCSGEASMTVTVALDTNQTSQHVISISLTTCLCLLTICN